MAEYTKKDTGTESEGQEAQPVQQAEEPEKKKAYYSPQEVMKKKGCIGCGGMVLAIALMAVGVLILAI